MVFKKNIPKLDNLNEYSIYAIILSLILGPALPDILATLLAIISVYLIFKNQKIDENFFIIISLFILILIPNIFSKYFPTPFIEQLINIRYFLFSLFICNFYNLKINNLINLILLITTIISLDLIFQYIFKINLIGMEIYAGHNQSRASSFFGDELIAGAYILKFSFPVLGYFLFYKKIKLSYGLILLYEIAIIFSGERMNFLLYNFGLIILLIFNYDKKMIKIAFITFISILIILLISIFNFKGVQHRIDTTINSFENNGYVNSQHLSHYIIGYNIWKSNILFGTGHKTFRLECGTKEYLIKTQSQENRGCATHPHNIYLEALSDSGIFGFISFMFFILFIIFKSFKNKIHKSEFNGFLITFYLMVWPLSTNGNFFNNRIAITNFLIIGIIAYASKVNLFNNLTKINLTKYIEAKKIK